MPELSQIIFGLLCTAMGVAAMAVVGHGIWIAVAAAVRRLSGGDADERSRFVQGKPCNACGAPQGIIGGRCGYCGFQPNLAPKARLKSDLEATARVLDVWQNEGLLDPVQLVALRETLAKSRVQLADGPLVSPETGTTPLATTSAEAAIAPAATQAFAPATDVTFSDQSRDVVVEAEVIVDDAAPPVAPREVHPLDRDYSADAGAAPAPGMAHLAKRRLADVLQAFMEDKNIRWGEIVAGLLIIGSAIGCVVSLQETLRKADPYVPAFLFMAATAAIYGAGMYTLRRWALQSISRALLIIALLLIPLNFLAATSSPERRSLTDPVYWLAVTVGLGVFGAICWSASRTLVRDAAWRLTVAVLGAAASQLLISRLATAGTGAAAASLLMALPAGAFLTAAVGQAWRASRWKALTAVRAEQAFVVAGVGMFSLAAATGLLVYRMGNLTLAFERLSPILCVVGASIVALGLAVSQRATSAKYATSRTAALAITLLGASLMTANLLFAWPDPQLMIVVGVVSFLALAAMAVLFRQPVLHAPAMTCLTLAYVVAFHMLLSGEYDASLGRQLLSLLWMGRTAAALAVLGAMSAGAGALLAKFRRGQDALYYFLAGGAITVAAVVIAAGVGFLRGPDADWATPILAVYAIALLAVAVIRSVSVTAAGGAGLLWAALAHSAALNTGMRTQLADAGMLPQRPYLFATLLCGAVLAALATVLSLGRRRPKVEPAPVSWGMIPESMTLPNLLAALRGQYFAATGYTIATLTLAALVVSSAAAPFALYVAGESVSVNAWLWAAIAAIWLAIAVIHRWPAMMSACGWAGTTAVVFAAAAIAQNQGWWSDTLRHPRFWQVQFAAAAVWSLMWSTVRRLSERRPSWKALLDPPWPMADQAALGVAIAGVLAAGVLACVPGVEAEFGMVANETAWTGVDRTLLQDAGAWIAWALVAIALVGALAARVSFGALLGLALALAAVPLLAAAPQEVNGATASALRWGFAAYGVATAAAICSRRALRGAVDRAAWLRRSEGPFQATEFLRSATFLLTLAPVFGLTVLAAVQFLGGARFGGPVAGSLLAAMPHSVLYAGPMLVLVGILTAFAIREKVSGYLLGASVLLQAAATLACLLAVAPLGDAAHTRVALLQWNAVSLGVFSLVWLGLGSRVATSEVERTPPLLSLQLGVAVVAVAALGLWSAASVFLNPVTPAAELRFLARIPSYVALALVTAAGAWWARRHNRGAWLHVAIGGAAVLGALAAGSAAPWASAQAWTGYYVLLGAWLASLLTATVVICVGGYASRRLSPVEGDSGIATVGLVQAIAGSTRGGVGWAMALGLAVVALALGASTNDPMRPWWSAAPVFAVACCAGALSLASNRRGFSYAGAVLTALSATLVAIGPFIGLWQRDEGHAILELLDANLIALSLAGGVSLTYFLRRRQTSEQSAVYFAPPVHSVIAVAATALFWLLTCGGLLLASMDRDVVGSGGVFVGGAMGMLTATALGGLLVASLWNTQGRYAVPCLYLWGMAAVAIVLDRLRLSLHETVFAVTVAAPGYVMLTSLLWRSGIGLAKVGARLGVPEPVEGLKRAAAWLPGVNALQAIPWTFLALWMVLGYEDRGMRYGAATAPLLLAIGVGSVAQLQRQRTMQMSALLLATIAAVFFAWADLEPSATGPAWLLRCVRLLIVLAAVAAIYSGVVNRLLSADHAWRGSVRRMTVATGGAAFAALAVVLLLEWRLFDPSRGVPGIHGPQIFAVAAVLLGLAAALVSVALWPKRDPLSLPEAQHVWYVYVAEVIAALLFAHVYMTMPQLFSGVLRQYWAYIVVVVAYAGVGLGELFRRSGVRVLAEPLGRTGVLLPLLPAVAFWAQASLTSYAGVLFWVGLLYVVLSIQHKSFTYGIAAGLAGNAALWALMQDRHFTLLAHPQFWLIPPALSVLTASHLTRNQLKESQLAAIRYASMLTIYLSSTGEMFLHGIGASLWPVMALAALSVGGVLAGIGLRVRAFLYLGMGFLLLSIISMVWHASKAFEHVWPWFAFLFVLGVAILVLFALFEKRRDDFLKNIERLQTWEL